MKTNLLTSRLRNRPGTQPNSPALLGGGQGAGLIKEVRSPGRTIVCPGTQASSPAKIRLRWLFFFFFLSLVACKSPATLTNDTQHHTRDSNYHASIQRIETHDTIIFGAPYIHSMVRPGDRTSLKAGGDACVPGHIAPQYPSPILRISDRKITIRDTVFVARTDTLLRTQTITQKERYIPPFYRFCTISFVTFVSFVTLAFSIHLLLRYLKIRSPT